jgi:uncharacterized damage-inducible protein DinB
MTPEEARGLAAYLFQTLDNEIATTRKILAAVPADQINFKLGEKGRTTAELMWHMVQSDRGFGEGIASRQLESFPEEGAAPKTAAEIVAAFDRDIPSVLEKVKSLTAEQLAMPVNFMNFATLPLVIYIGWWANHMIHHRGQLSTYLRAMNAHVPSIYGGSADEPYGAAATA